jgi:hypothetical protein
MTEKPHALTGNLKKGWWGRLLDRLIKANKESLQQGCKT